MKNKQNRHKCLNFYIFCLSEVNAIRFIEDMNIKDFEITIKHVLKIKMITKK